MKDKLEIRLLTAADVPEMAVAFQRAGSRKTAPLFNHYLNQQHAGRRDVLIARLTDPAKTFAGYLTIVWSPEYEPFREDGIPEINDFNVLPELRRQGIGSRLMDEAERIISSRSAYSGIGVGMGADYGPAHRLYVLRGYIPDGRGLMDDQSPVKYGKSIKVSHDLAIYFTKKLD